MTESQDATDDKVTPGNHQDAMLPESDVADNFRDYIEALEAEIAMSEAAIEAMLSGDISTEEIVEALPSPSPMELWNTDRWRDRPDGYDATQLNTPDKDADHE